MSTVTTTEGVREFTVDAAHSNVEFVVRHLMISKVRGRFAGVTGSIALEPGSDVPKEIAITIDAASVDTREAQRDAHLRSADFFDVEHFPHLSYRSTRIEGTPESFRVHGDLTIRGVTREVTLEGEFEGRGNDPWGGVRAGYSAHAKLSRKDFGLLWNQALETGGVAVGDEVRIEINVEAVQQS